MNARCVFKLNENIVVMGMDLTDETLSNFRQKLIELLEKREAELIVVENYFILLENQEKEIADIPSVDCTFLEINVNLSQSQVELWKINKQTIFDKTIEQLNSKKVYLTSLWSRNEEQHIGFVTDF
ncbi:hypothetical protein ACI6PS_11560 [Flavobacterium sp. PLA-1-15]|uniref:hypothetical protein n=1 Tax=Flavobacterium sp. PLA-1-15 TaxID=3380533 RepID=UPI003B812F9F